MATLNELQEAFRTFAERGDVEKAKEVLAIMRAMQAEDEALRVNPEIEDPGAMQAALIGAGRTTDRLIKGVKQLYHGTRSALGDKNSDKELEELKAQAEDDDRIYSMLQEQHPFATGLGEALPSVAVPGGAAAKLGQAALRMGATGAALPALEYGSLSERAKRAGAGAVAGALTPAVAAALGKAGSAVWRAGKNAVKPLFQKGQEQIVADALSTATRDAPGNVVARLASAKQNVPGSRQTAAQAAGSPGLAALERSAARFEPELYQDRWARQASARLGALKQIAGSDQAYAAAQAARSAAADKSYRHAYMAGVDQEAAKALKPQIDALLERPSIKRAMSTAKELAEEEGLAIDNFGSVQGLHFLKESLDDMIGQAAPKMQRRLMQTKKDLISVLEEISPEYVEANARFARLSRPINRMELGRELVKRMEPSLNEYGAQMPQAATRFANSLRDADRTARAATGFKGSKFRKVLEPDDVKVVEAIARDLASASRASRPLARGAGTKNDLIMDDMIQSFGPRAAKALHSSAAVRLLLGPKYERANALMKRRLAEALLEPAEVARYITESRARMAGLKKADDLRRRLQNRAARIALPAPLAVSSAAVAPEAAASADELSLELPD